MEISSIRYSDAVLQLSSSNLAILHLDPTLQGCLNTNVQLLIGTSVLNFIHHPEAGRIEMEILQHTSDERANSKVLRCMMRRIASMIRYTQTFLNHCSSAQIKDDDYQLTDIRLELVGNGAMLCFFHSVEGIAKQYDNGNRKSQRPDCCGTMLSSLNDQQFQKLLQHIFSKKMVEPSPSTMERHWNGFPE